MHIVTFCSLSLKLSTFEIDIKALIHTLRMIETVLIFLELNKIISTYITISLYVYNNDVNFIDSA